jgi:hypothetical protein
MSHGLVNRSVREYPYSYWSLKKRVFHRFCTHICQQGPSVLLSTNAVTFSSKLLKNLAGEADLLESVERPMMMLCSNASHVYTSSRNRLASTTGRS